MSNQQFSLADLVDVLVRRAGLPVEAAPDDATTTLTAAGLDSLAFLQLQAELADNYAVELPDERAQEYTFGDIVAHVNDGLEGRRAA